MSNIAMADKNAEKNLENFKKKTRVDGYLNNLKKCAELLEKAKKKAKEKGPIKEVWDKLQLLFSIFGDYISGKYKDIPVGSIILIILAILYFVSPIDAIPDFLLPFGLFDDGGIIALVVAQVNSDLEKYKK